MCGLTACALLRSTQTKDNETRLPKKAFITFAILLLLACSSEPAQLRIKNTKITGIKKDRGAAFLSLPYASAKRFQSPSLYTYDEAQTLSAFEKQNPCPQERFPISMALGKLYRGSEDCLNMNIFTPDLSGKKLAVFVFFHGGGYELGSNNDFGEVELYDFSHFAAKHGVIVVAPNYRLGAFGFFAHPFIQEASPKESLCSDCAIDDMVAALRWVQAHISHFGGDPTNVTIGGESAGAHAAKYLVESSHAGNLFKAAIIQSAPNGSPTLEEAQRRSLVITKKAGCHRDDLKASFECMRKLSAKDLLQAQGSLSERLEKVRSESLLAHRFMMRFSPVVHPKESVSRRPIPLILGTNANEFDMIGNFANDSDKFQNFFHQLSGNEQALERLSAVYKMPANRIFGRFITDSTFTCANLIFAKSHTETTNADVYHYMFTESPWRSSSLQTGLGASHGLEIPYAFENLPWYLSMFLSNYETTSSLVGGYWANFIKESNPNFATAPLWTPYSDTFDKTLHLNHKAELKTYNDRGACAQIKSLIPQVLSRAIPSESGL